MKKPKVKKLRTWKFKQWMAYDKEPRAGLYLDDFYYSSKNEPEFAEDWPIEIVVTELPQKRKAKK